jgi:hypothetical protein
MRSYIAKPGGANMSKHELEKMLAAFERVHQQNDTREKSLAFLVEAGIATPDGQLAKPYRDLSEE